MAQILCFNDVDGSHVPFVDCHNGWGLTALHIAVFQGSVNTGARAPAGVGTRAQSVATLP